MMKKTPSQLAGRRALVTGASSGIGAALARELAALGCPLVVVARRGERLEILARDLREREGVTVDVLPRDLTARHAADEIVSWLEERRLDVDVLVNAAGVGCYGPFAEIDGPRETAMLRLNVDVVTELTRALLPGMIRRRFGRVIQVASLAGLVPLPGYATYAATKAFVIHQALAMDRELAPLGVRILALCPGLTRTEFFAVAGQDPKRLPRIFLMSAGVVAQQAVRGLLRGRSMVVPGLRNRLLAFLIPWVPRRWAVTVSSWFV